jgi:hypothetical protein
LKYELEENQDLEPVDKKSATSFPNKYWFDLLRER